MNLFVLKISHILLNLKSNRFLESIHSTLFISIILMLSYVSFSLNANEEQYMLFAKQFMNPDWIQSRYLNEFPGTRLLYQTIIGFFLKYFSFETVLFSSRFILCIVSAIPIAKIYKELKMTNAQALLHLPILFLSHQSFFAGSWMLISVESKGFSYVFILFSLLYFIRKNYKYMILFLVLATYFHILVGGYAFIFFTASILLFDKSKNRLYFVKLSFAYGLAIIPFILYLKTAITTTIDHTPSINWIYSYYRHPHHIGLFSDLTYFYNEHLYGVLLTFVALIFSIFYFKINKNEKIQRLNHFVLLSIIGVLIALVIAYFDTDGVIIKYYPFRINTFTTFIFSIIITDYIFKSFKTKSNNVFINMVILMAIWFTLKLFIPNITSIKAHITNSANPTLENITNYIKDNTNKEAVVLSFIEDNSLNRRMERDRFVVYKFIPAEMNAIPEWYEREQFKIALAEGTKSLIDLKNEGYKVDYLLSDRAINSRYLELITSEKPYFFYKIIIN